MLYKKLLELIHEFSRLQNTRTVCKNLLYFKVVAMNNQNLTLKQNTKNLKVQKAIPWHQKYHKSGINLSKDVQDLSTEN